MTRLPEIADPNTVVDMEPEELAPIILRYLQKQKQINRYNFSLVNDLALVQALGRKADEYAERLMEAWAYLEREGFIAAKPGDSHGWSFVTKKGRAIVDAQDFDAYQKSSLFPADLDPVLTQAVKPLFIRGDYDTAVFRAFKEVEVRVRKKAGASEDDYGVDLMKKAFGPGGVLENKIGAKGERDRMRELFTGAIGSLKNPSSHRDVKFDDPREVIDVISFANHLLRIVERA